MTENLLKVNRVTFQLTTLSSVTLYPRHVKSPDVDCKYRTRGTARLHQKSKPPACQARGYYVNLSVERAGFEPAKAYASRFTVCPVWPLRYLSNNFWSWRTDLNRQPADYKSAALPLSYASH